MSEYGGFLLSTSFRVRDRNSWLADPDVQRMQEQAKEAYLGFFVEEDGLWTFGWEIGDATSSIILWPDEEELPEELDILEVLQRHLAEGEVCKIIRSGNEKMAIVGGAAYWVTPHGSVRFDAEITCWAPDIVQETEADLIRQAEEFCADVHSLLRSHRRGSAAG